MRVGSTSRTDILGRVAFAAVLGVAFAGASVRAQYEKTISATFDGWSKAADGSIELVFGYMNRNAGDIAIPLGAANQLDPAPSDRGQPTNFLPGRQRNVFRIKVPADFKGKYVWTLNYAGLTQAATASLDQNYSLDVGDPEPPTVKAPPDVSARVNQPVKLAPTVGPAPRPPVQENAAIVERRSQGAPISVWWSKFRGPGLVTFGEGSPADAGSAALRGREQPPGTFRVSCANPPGAECGATTARFSEAGTYWIRVVAAERSASNALIRVNVTP